MIENGRAITNISVCVPQEFDEAAVENVKATAMHTISFFLAGMTGDELTTAMDDPAERKSLFEKLSVLVHYRAPDVRGVYLINPVVE